ncbi:hypothetical protein LTR72_011088 [Exophiala xenobiotica]|nr:hypothetical protein LTR72_011088 [Exophiala xenobiotica]KAK5285097.1 hypothetical protein LTR14_011242 [Exophiala xenobiotica]KAK5312152.1 hypothetical protein LTR93_011440 [Exophiala xenobiotica]KAK5470005.1 hypothetical protein LTR55_011238 [Exophiala xenobiotica]
MYISGNDPEGHLVFLGPDGEWCYPSVNNSLSVPTEIPASTITIHVQGIGQAVEVALPTDISAGRIWLAHGDLKFSVVSTAAGNASLVQPSVTIESVPTGVDVSWGFVEFTYAQGKGLWVNLSYVDFVGLALGIILTSASPETSPVASQWALGLQSNATSTICRELANQSMLDGHPWGDLCLKDSYSRPFRILSPNTYIQMYADAFVDYWTSYIDQVWTRYTTQGLTINTQSEDLGNVSCSVASDSLICASANVSVSGNAIYTKPSAKDIFSCNSGPFAASSDLYRAVTPRLCSAINRSTLLLSGGDIQPDGVASSLYYNDEVTNWYSKLVHQWEIEGKGYAFPYDDISPSMEHQGQAGELTSDDPWVLTLLVGGALG